MHRTGHRCSLVEFRVLVTNSYGDRDPHKVFVHFGTSTTHLRQAITQPANNAANQSISACVEPNRI